MKTRKEGRERGREKDRERNRDRERESLNVWVLFLGTDIVCIQFTSVIPSLMRIYLAIVTYISLSNC
jgi:hypothetical protein